VWAVLEHIERHVDWMADARAIDFASSQRYGVGTRFTCATAIGPLRVDDRMEITDWQPERAMGVRHQGVVTGEGRFELAPLDGGRRTRFTWREELRFPWWLGGPLAARLGGAAVLRRVWKGNLSRLKKLVERAR
jgi:Polyketide cyclase / dehydrase and lipid transport